VNAKTAGLCLPGDPFPAFGLYQLVALEMAMAFLRGKAGCSKNPCIHRLLRGG
jgi:hypothetical protein